MGINKVQINKNNKLEVLIDLTKDTVTEDTLLEGYTSHDKDGEPIVGKAKLGEDVTNEVNTYTTELVDLRTRIQNLSTVLDGKATGGSGGGSVETCTVTIDVDNTRSMSYFCILTTIENGNISSTIVSESSTFSNVIKNSMVQVIHPEDTYAGAENSNGYDLLPQEIQYLQMFSDTGMMLENKIYLLDDDIIVIFV